MEGNYGLQIAPETAKSELNEGKNNASKDDTLREGQGQVGSR